MTLGGKTLHGNFLCLPRQSSSWYRYTLAMTEAIEMIDLYLGDDLEMAGYLVVTLGKILHGH